MADPVLQARDDSVGLFASLMVREAGINRCGRCVNVLWG